jgi:hypothetical protein
MFMTCFPHKEFLAKLLPLSLLWVFVACVSLCARESTHIPTQRVIALSGDVNMIKDVPDCDGCPLNSFPKATAPEQTKLLVNLEAALSGSSPAMPPNCYLNPDILSGPPHGQLCTASPPLELRSPPSYLEPSFSQSKVQGTAERSKGACSLR